ncbi:hypothetical protein [Sulfobacillus harzensis]|uniref:Uncharacterized protein n=1 Tax=Sulfobacillus harzensis TaxID=2729629 RepID=A0A7Y0L582_9FIRM|nr:hypothetical protein [Sulfobacillus harzensis]NMP23440.1 hypothetical protein [Sulfobacillus harzensis]
MRHSKSLRRLRAVSSRHWERYRPRRRSSRRPSGTMAQAVVTDLWTYPTEETVVVHRDRVLRTRLQGALGDRTPAVAEAQFAVGSLFSASEFWTQARHAPAIFAIGFPLLVPGGFRWGVSEWLQRPWRLAGRWGESA